MSIRTKVAEDLKTSMLARDQVKTAALRLIQAAIRDKDIASRTAESRDGISEEQIMALLQSMVKQRRESITIYQNANRPELADKEQSEIDVIETYLPKQMSDEDAAKAVDAAIAATGAASIKDMGKIMAELKGKYAGQMDFSKVGGLVKDKLK